MPDMTPEQIDQLIADRDRLQAQVDAERQRAEAESRRADHLDGQVRSSSRQVAESNVANLTAQAQQADATVNTLTQTIASLRTQRQALLEEGKFAEEGEINEKIAEAVAQRQQAQQAKTYFEQQRQQAAAQPTDPVERFLTTNNFSEAEKTWIRQNPRYATDAEFQARVIQAHTAALNKGIVRQSPEYFEELSRAGYMRPDPAPQMQPQHRQAGGAAAGDDADPGAGPDDGAPYSEAAAQSPAQEPPVQQPPRQPSRASTAAPPSRRPSASAQPQQRQVLARFTEDQMETAYRLYEQLNPTDSDGKPIGGTQAEIAQWWYELETSPMAQRKREEWRSM